MREPVLTTRLLGLPRLASGKVRDLYDLGDTLLLVATDRISAFDVVMPNGIPDKGRVLTQLSHFWFSRLGEIVPAHEITVDTEEICDRLKSAGVPVTEETRTLLDGRSVIGKKAGALPIECVVRGYLAGSLLKEYRAAGGETGEVSLHGITLPGGLREGDRLSEPIFTPATKAAAGHDENIGIEEAGALIGIELAERLQEESLALYGYAADYARARGILLADTKFEFGLLDGELLWIDEAFTPDSSRYWLSDTYAPGGAQPSFDKQFVRDWLEASGWNKEPPAPPLPESVVLKTAEKYREAYSRLTGSELD